MIEQWRLRLVTAPVVEPVSLDEAKEHLRVEMEMTDEDPLIDSMTRSVRAECESIARRAFVTQTWDLILDAWPTTGVIEVPLPPLQSVTSITYVDSDEIGYTMPATDYGVDADSEPGRIYLKAGKSWPGGSLRQVAGVKVRFVAGFSSADLVPDIYKAAIRLGLDVYYNNRDGASVQQSNTIVSLLTMDRGSW